MEKRTPSSRYAEIEQEVRRLVAAYIKLFGLERWDVTLAFNTRFRERASTDTSDEYMEVIMSFNPKRLAESGEDLNKLVRHEFAHIYNAPVEGVGDVLAGKEKIAKEMVREASERCATHWERAPFWDQIKVTL